MGGKLSKYSKGQIIQSTEGQRTINLVTRGFAKRYLISSTGSLRVEVIYGKDDIFPLTLMFKTFFAQDIYEGPEVYFYEAMGDTSVYAIDIQLLEQAVQNNPWLYRDLLSESGRRLQSTLSGLENLTLKSPYNRLAHHLAYLGNQFGEKLKSGSSRITIPLTFEDLADMLNLDTKTVSNCLAKLKDKNFVKVGKHIIITDLDKIKEEAHR
jgi:CRP-like cAMP-binding protein